MTHEKIFTVHATCSGSAHMISVIKTAVGFVTGQEMISRLSSLSKWERCVLEERGPKEKVGCVGELEE